MVAANNKAPKGKYTTSVSFIVEKDGSVSNLNASTNYGYGIEYEAIKVVESTSGKWKPAMLRGRNVRYILNQPVTFVIY